MAAFQDKMMVNSAITESTKMDLSCDFITTGDFFEVTPVYIKEMVPGEHIKIVSEEFTRLQPLNVPTFGRGNVNTRGFFVPMRTIMSQWNEFITDAPSVTGGINVSTAPTMVIPGQVPSFSAEVMTEAFLRQCGVTGFPAVANVDSWGSATTTQPTVFDYAVSVQGTVWYLTLNQQGRRVKKTIESLGYKLYPMKSTAVGTYPNVPELVWSALPLFAVAKIYVDWYINSAYGILYEDALYIERMLKNVDPSYYTVQVGPMAHLLDFIVMANYDSDYFVSAWDNPVSPNPGAFTAPVIFKDVTVSGTSLHGVTTQVDNVGGPNTDGGRNLYNTPRMVGLDANGNYTSSTSPYQISEYALTALKSLTDYMKRHQMVGVHAFDRYLSRFGKGLADEQLDRSKYLGAHKGSLQFGDIMSTSSDTSDGKGLGSFAGKGISYDKGTFEFTTNEYGYIVLISSIIPSVGYFQGIDRNILHVNKLDFWTPEFDNLGVQTINSSELFVPINGADPTVYSYSYTFGFTPRYSEYKFSKDRLTGDFTVNSINWNKDLDAWHFMRRFDSGASFLNDPSNIVHSKDFVNGSIDGDQYNRIFQTWDSKAPQDMFWMIWHFDVISHSPMKSMFDVYEFEDKGRKIVEEVNGVKMN